jgi:hypothetical protein
MWMTAAKLLCSLMNDLFVNTMSQPCMIHTKIPPALDTWPQLACSLFGLGAEA